MLQSLSTIQSYMVYMMMNHLKKKCPLCILSSLRFLPLEGRMILEGREHMRDPQDFLMYHQDKLHTCLMREKRIIQANNWAGASYNWKKEPLQRIRDAHQPLVVRAIELNLEPLQI